MKEQAQNWAVACITFHPPDNWETRMRLVEQSGRRLYLWKNSKEHTSAVEAVVLHEGESNVGLGPALKALLSQAKADGYDYLWYVDQDTVFTSESLRYINDFLQQQAFPSTFSAIRFAEWDVKPLATNQPTALKVLLSSGTLFRLACNATHDAGFFVEGVDYQYCLDAAVKGWKLGQLGCPGLRHENIQPAWVFQVGRFQRVYRPYPWRRHKGFLWSLIRLSIRALLSGKLNYTLIFSRNVLTHLVKQVEMLFMVVLTRMGLAKKAVNL